MTAQRGDETRPGDVCWCAHDRGYHGNADGQTGWQARCGHPACECENFEDVLVLQAELDELERTDPEVRAAADSYDRMVERITGRTLPPRDGAR